MAQPPLPPSLAAFPPDLIQAVAGDAARDADRVGSFLVAVGLAPPLRLPADFLLGLGAALRMLMWEHRGIHLHRDAGLPPARQALREVFRAATGQAEAEALERVRDLACRVMILSIEYLAWNGRVELDADVVLGEADQEHLLEALADFLWAHRPS